MFSPSQIFLNQKISSRGELFEFIAQQAVKNNIVSDSKIIIDGLKKREKLGSTILSYNMAFPHFKSELVSQTIIFLISLQKPIKYSGQNTAKIIFCIISPIHADEFLQYMSNCAYITLNKEALHSINENQNLEQVCSILNHSISSRS